DGTGNPWFKGDLAIRGDRIAALGRVDPETPARRTIDAERRGGAPGVLDQRPRSDRPPPRDRARGRQKPRRATARGPRAERPGSRAQGHRPAERFERDGKSYEWTTLGGYFDTLESARIATTVASYVGLGTLLDCVQGKSLDRPGQQHLEAIAKLLDEAMRDGA